IKSDVSGRMAGATAISLLIVSIIPLLLKSQHDKFVIWAQALSVLVSYIGLILLISYLYDSRVIYSFSLYRTMAPHTAFLLLLTGLGFLYCKPNQGFVAVFTNKLIGGRLIRPILIPGLFATLLITWAIRFGEIKQLYS